MAGERRINWGANATDAKYRTEDTGDGADFIVAEDLDGGTILLQWNDTAGQWESQGPVELNGNDVSGVGTLTATTVSTDEINNNSYFVPAGAMDSGDISLSSANNEAA